MFLWSYQAKWVEELKIGRGSQLMVLQFHLSSQTGSTGNEVRLPFQSRVILYMAILYGLY